MPILLTCLFCFHFESISQEEFNYVNAEITPFYDPSPSVTGSYGCQYAGVINLFLAYRLEQDGATYGPRATSGPQRLFYLL